MNLEHDPTQNRLLAELDIAEFHRLSPYLELVSLARGEVLYQSGGRMTHVYFPTTATVSIDYILKNGSTSEIASVGNEGLLGISLFMGGGSTPNRAVVPIPGFAYRLGAGRLLDEFYHKGPLLRLLLRYTQALLTQISQLAVCNGHHTTEQRLCRWLLQMLDRTPSDELAITQEAIAAILGVRREGITDAAGHLQILDIIKWRRGHVSVLSRSGLEAQACECYEVVSRESSRLLSTLAPGKSKMEHGWRQRGEIANRRSGCGERRRAPERAVEHAMPGQLQSMFEFP